MRDFSPYNLLGLLGPNHQRGLSRASVQTISEAAIWCSQREILGNSLRSTELDPFALLEMPSFPHDRESIRTWIEKKRDSYRHAILWINQTRSELLKTAGVTAPGAFDLLNHGKLLLYNPLENVADGASEAASTGFYDIDDAPPWDTWFLYENEAIFCYVPESAVSAAQAGIDANPVDCIHWADWSEVARVGK